MNSEKPVIDLEVLPPKAGRQGDGGTYLVVADDSDEFRIALRYACVSAKKHRARVGILHIAEDGDFQHWSAVENRIKKELRDQSEQYLFAVAKSVNEHGLMPSYYIGQGEPGEALLAVINTDESIVQIILGGKPEHGPGPLVAFCTGKGLSRIKIPVVIVPGHLKDV